MKKKLEKLLSFVLIMTIALAFALTGGSSNAAAGDQWDLNNFVTGIEIRNASGGQFNGTPVDGTTYQLNVEFSESIGGSDGQFALNGSDNMVYTLPESVKLIADISSKNITIGTVVVGTYSAVASTGVFTIKFNEVLKDGTPNPDISFIEAYTDVIFTLNLSARFNAGDETGTIHIDFGNNYYVDFYNAPPVITPPGIGLTKAASSINGDKITYSVTITAQGEAGDKIEEITLNDKPFTRTVLSGTGSTNKVGLTAAQRAAYGPFSYQINGTGTSYPITPTWSDTNGFHFDFTGVVLTPGQRIVLKYTADVEKLLEGSTSFTDAYYVGNDATASAKDVGSKNASTISETLVRTTRTSKSNSNNNANTWTASVGNGTAKLNGATITDTMTSGNATYPVVFPAAENIQVQFFTTRRASSASYTLTAAQLAGYGLSIDSGTNVLTFNLPAEGSTAPAGVPGGAFGSIYRVQLVYKTEIPTIAPVASPATATSARHTNTIRYGTTTPAISSTANRTFTGTVTGGGGTGTGDSIDGIPANNISIAKTSSGPRENSAKNGYEIEYTITVDVAAGNESKVFFIYDTLSGSGSLTNSPSITDVTISPSPTGLEPAFKYKYFSNTGTGNQYWAMVFGETPSGTTLTQQYLLDSKWQYNDKKTITIKYTLPIISTIEASLKSTNGLTNRITVAVPTTTGFRDIKYVSVTDRWPISKTVNAAAGNPTTFDYTVTLNGNSPRKQLFTTSGTGAAIFKDTFAVELGYVPNSFYVTLGSSTRDRYKIDGSDITVAGNALTVDLKDLKLNGTGAAIPATTLYGSQQQIVIHYQLKIKDPSSLDGTAATHTFGNTATIEATELGGDFSADANATYTDKSVAKTMPAPSGSTTTGGSYGRPSTTSGPNIAKATITINADGLKLEAGGGATGKITAIDTMSANLRAYRNTIKVYKFDGTSWVLQTMSENNTGDEWTMQFIGTNVIEFVIPDETPVRIEYDVLITSTVGSSETHNNKIEISGRSYSNTSTLSNYTVSTVSASASANIANVTVTKVDSVDTSIRLEGAKFGLYMAIPENGIYDGIATDYIEWGTSTFYSGNSKFYLLEEKTTDAAGTTTFTSNFLTPSHDALYLLAELEPPTSPSGYPLPSAPDNYTFFVLGANTPFTSGFATDNSVTVSIVADSLTITNTLPVGPIYDLALKKWVSSVRDNSASNNVDYIEPADGADVSPASVKIGDKVTFKIKVINQGNKITRLTVVVDYMPPGYSFSAIDNTSALVGSWNWNNTSEEYLVFTPTGGFITLQPGRTNNFTIIDLVLTVNIDATNGNPAYPDGNLDNFAEISGMADENGGTAITDIDSTPDSIRNNDGTVKDNVVNENGRGKPTTDDEDDHDVARVILIEDVQVSTPAIIYVDYALNIQKTITGIDAADSIPLNGFEFNIKEVDANGALISNSLISFNNNTISFDKADFNSGVASNYFEIYNLVEGSYYFEIRENLNYEPGWQKDPTIYYIKLDVKEVSAELVVTESRKTDSAAGYVEVYGNLSGVMPPAEFTNEYDEQHTLEYDAALQKWVMQVNSTVIGTGANAPNTLAPIVNTGDKVMFAIRIINQGDKYVIITDVSDYIPSGFEFDPNDNTGWDVDGSRLTYKTRIDLDIDESEIIYLTLTVKSTGSLYNLAEISEMRDSDLKIVDDRDSTPDKNPNNDGTPHDNVIDNSGGDEDDHDFAEVKRPPDPYVPTTTDDTDEETDDDSDDPATVTEEEPDTDDDTDTETTPEPPYTPGGNDPYVPPVPTTPGSTLIQDGDGWIELDEDGVPLGRWTWDEDEEMWIFEEDIPLADALPNTGNNTSKSLLIFLMGACLLGSGMTMSLRSAARKRRGNKQN